jgi:hypothetical protein
LYWYVNWNEAYPLTKTYLSFNIGTLLLYDLIIPLCPSWKVKYFRKSHFLQPFDLWENILSQFDIMDIHCSWRLFQYIIIFTKSKFRTNLFTRIGLLKLKSLLHGKTGCINIVSWCSSVYTLYQVVYYCQDILSQDHFLCDIIHKSVSCS